MCKSSRKSFLDVKCGTQEAVLLGTENGKQQSPPPGTSATFPGTQVQNFLVLICTQQDPRFKPSFYICR